MRKLTPMLCALALVAMGCGARTVRIDPDQEPENKWGYTGTSSQDLRTTTQKMAEAIMKLSVIVDAATPPTVAFRPVKNNSAEYINTSAFLDEIRAVLIQNAGGRIRFLDRELTDAILEERGMKREGVVGASGKKDLLGVDYFLTGQIDSIDTAGKGRRSTYVRYSFRLTDAESSAIVWQDRYQVKKAALSPLWDR